MRTITATQASRGFSALLDAVEHGAEEIVIERDGRAVARMLPMTRHRASALIESIKRLPTADHDDDLGAVIDETRALLTTDEPWHA
ncbi:type II toxin-antitoxin system Phd/YefM family antitoxin [Gryllotalpicola koreensis]|uniref:Antitoxin n=1 Tax=Gryllotalpicola koreensis TaxID=993086 RepID=A0ABP8AAE8_9MICO